MPTKIFISYRREEAKHQANELYNLLTDVLQDENLFLDIKSIPPATDFVEVLRDRVSHSDLVLALIGAGWASSTNPSNGKRRLYECDDFVCSEIQEAFARGITVVPVLLDGARMPHPDELPEKIRDITRQQAEFIDFRTFDHDVKNLIKRLRIGRDWGARILRRASASGFIAGMTASAPFIVAALAAQSNLVEVRPASTLWGSLLFHAALPQAFLISVFAGGAAAICGRTSGKRSIVCFVVAAILVGAAWSELVSSEIFVLMAVGWLIAAGITFWFTARWLGLPMKWNDRSASRLQLPW